MIRAALALILAACAAAPPPAPTAAEALAPLIGCWRGTFEGQPDIIDERCFQTLGEHVVDTHHVRPTAYAGETTYHLDEAHDVIVFAYAANDGGRSNGALSREANTIDIAPHVHIAGGGEQYRLRSTWTLEPPDRLVMATEREEDGAWRPFMRIEYVRAPDLAPPR